MKNGRVLGRRNLYERQVILLLRGGTVFELRGMADARAAFDALAAAAFESGLTIFPLSSPFVSDGEVALISAIAAAQRRGGEMLPRPEGLALAPLLTCADILRNAGIWLPSTRLANGPAIASRPNIDRPRSVSPRAVALARVMSFAQSRDVASTEDFIGIGVSRQYVSRLCKDGYLQRVRFGWYRAATLPAPAAGPQSQHI